ncbi:HEAT repeat domain-containing protein (plasmid) [Halolamina sp. CBA1230]|uniref:HEAT repeat domain-containing protein n=1 Tax=Halolamina sp. CBA1230 TaxID=1853690 RepID=UPI0009A23FFB|nr:HEAT repeat domain-containing protein [Halolamina sp. CBA1230]QKY21827.1 HEAT repeat domain-containing protein [Halolamina sp. CBA1230]
MLVFAFDRDWTVDVNPHPNREAVPLEWVRHLAHETPHAVYAIGNQSLAEEAAIPGVVDVVGRHSDEWDEWLGEKQPDGRYERFPERRERLALIADLHPDAEGYVVVDDLDLSDVDSWEHYHAWEFVPAVEAGDVHPELPWAREPRPDGGRSQGPDESRPSSAGIMPTDASHLSSFLEEHSDAPGFELTYAEDGTERTELLHDLSVVQRSVDRPSAAPAAECTPVSPAQDAFTVRIDDIGMLSIAEPPVELYTGSAETPEETAVGLRRLASVNPEAVRVPSILALLDTAHDDTSAGGDTRDRAALDALRQVARVRPADCMPAIPILRSLLGDADPQVQVGVLATLYHLGRHDAAAIAPLTDEISTALASSNDRVRGRAARCMAEIAADHPADAVDAVPSLAAVIGDDLDDARYAVFALSRVADAYPDEVKPVVSTLAETAVDDAVADQIRLNATAGLGRVVGEYPSVGVDLVDELIALLDTENGKLRNNAIGVIGDVALVHTDVVEPYTEKIAPLLSEDDEFARVNASGALSRVAEDFPDSVAHLTPTFVALLDAESALVRENACWALGHLGAAEARSALAARAAEDDDPAVRERASWALDQI